MSIAQTKGTAQMRLGMPKPSLNLLVPPAIIILTLVAGMLLIAATGASVPDALSALWAGAFGSSYAIGASLNRAVVFILIGLGFILAEKAQLTNVGGEGQIALGGVMATAAALHGAAELPLVLAVALPLIAGTLAGAFWGAIAGVLKVKRGTNEVISTLLLSFIAVNILYWSVQSENLLRKPRTSAATQPESLRIPEITQLPRISSDPSSPLHIGLAIALIAAIVVGILLSRSVFGLRLKAIGLNVLAARRAGVGENLQILALAIAGGFGGLAGAVMLLGDQHVLKIGFSSNYGFDGVVVGLLARGSATGVVAGALFFAFLRSGGITMEMMASVPSAIVWICQGMIVIAIAGASAWLNYRLKAQRG